MKVQVTTKGALSEKSGILAVGVFQKEKGEAPELPEIAAEVDKATDGAVKDAYAESGFDGAKGETHAFRGWDRTTILLVGLGPRKKVDLDALRSAAGRATRAAQKMRKRRLATALHLVQLEDDPGFEARAEAVTLGAFLGAYRFEDFKSKNGDEPEKVPVDTLALHADGGGSRVVRRAADAALVIAESVALARDLANTPGNVATPPWLANKARRLAKEHALKAKILGLPEAKKHRMGGLIGVAQGSEHPPRLVALEHKPKRSQGKPYKTVCLVGKGITFDTGGISLKPGAKMDEMKFDKCGATAIMATMVAVARLQLPIHVVGIMAFAENMPSGSAYKPGDILKMANGKTVEVLNTDAEGRMVLADALWYAHKYAPDAIVDAATLTGAIDVALGPPYGGLMGSDDDLIERLRKAGDAAGERLWPMPLGDAYQDMIKGTYGDIQNIGGRSGGALTAGQFLRNFVEEDKVKWAHLDIAATAWGEGDDGYTPKGATGVGVRTFVRFLQGLVA